MSVLGHNSQTTTQFDPLAVEIIESKFDRDNVNGLKPFITGKIPAQYEGFYTQAEADELIANGVEDRMKAKISEHYRALAMTSEPIKNLVKARVNEVYDLAGEQDPSNQLSYSPVPGLLHKYELVLLYSSMTCSAHCRYCYRLDLFSGKTGKGLVKPDAAANYVREFNEKARAGEAIDNEGLQRFPIREALLSGGDPMVLSNRKLFDYMSLLADAGVRIIRIGTKELAFFPQRFDDNFFDMLDKFHVNFPRTHIAMMVHFTHPDEFLVKDENGNYIEEHNGRMQWIEAAEYAVSELGRRNYVSMENQTPIIYQVNDDADALRLMQKELRSRKIRNHYYFQCREIEGHRAFAVPVEESWRIHNESQKGLSGIEKSRFAMSTEWGKMEVMSMIDGANIKELAKGLPRDAQILAQELFGDGLIFFKIMRSPHGASTQGQMVIAKRNPEALWISGYEDRIIYDAREEGDARYKGLGGLFAKAFADQLEAA
jgi:lysine 2,3-aminomutase